MEIFLDALKDAAIDTALTLPILYLAYLLVGYFSHNNNEKYSKILHHTKKAGPLVGAFLGCVPQCGFSSVMSNLYNDKVVTLGTLMAVFIATSDEAIPLMVSKPEFIPKLLILLGFKVLLAVIIGYSIDLVVHLITIRRPQTLNDYEEPHHHEHGHCCAKNIFLDALKHTVIIALYVFIATLVINLIFGYAGTDFFRTILTDNVYIQILIASLIGLIPNCSASVFLVELYMSGIIAGTPVLSFAALCAGLCAGAGVGLIVLYTTGKKNVLRNLGITGLLYIFAVCCGLIVSLFNIV